MQVVPVLKKYSWGRESSSSIIKNFIIETNAKEFLTADHLAEIWFGTHERGTSKLISNDIFISLKEHLNRELKYLVKILSIGSPLSIQVHPIKSFAERLNLHDPENYPDKEEKWEMGIAISEVTLLKGYNPIEENLTRARAFGLPESDSNISLIKSLLQLEKQKIAECISILKSNSKLIPATHVKVFLELESKYSNDSGILLLPFMRYLTLEKHTAVVIEPGELHAYLSGELIEVMIPSDNVIRAGLTNKLIDIPSLSHALTTTEGQILPNFNFLRKDNYFETRLYHSGATINAVKNDLILFFGNAKIESTKIPRYSARLCEKEKIKLEDGFCLLVREL